MHYKKAEPCLNWPEVATIGELGCYPLMIRSFTQMIKYWHHIETELDNSSLIYKVVSILDGKQGESRQHNWLSTVKFILRYCGIEKIWLNLIQLKMAP